MLSFLNNNAPVKPISSTVSKSRHRVALGKPCTAIHWGAWGEAGRIFSLFDALLSVAVAYCTAIRPVAWRSVWPQPWTTSCGTESWWGAAVMILQVAWKPNSHHSVIAQLSQKLLWISKNSPIISTYFGLKHNLKFSPYFDLSNVSTPKFFRILLINWVPINCPSYS